MSTDYRVSGAEHEDDACAVTLYQQPRLLGRTSRLATAGSFGTHQWRSDLTDEKNDPSCDRLPILQFMDGYEIQRPRETLFLT